MLLRDFLFAMLIISGVVLGFGSFYTDLAVRYNVPAPTTSLNSFYQINNTLSIANSLQNNQTGIAAMLQNIPLAGSFAAVLIAGTQVLTVMLQIPNMFLGMVTDVGAVFGLPSWFTSIIIIAITVIVIMAIIGQSVVKGRV